MENSIFIAKVISAIYLSIGLGLFFNTKHYTLVFKKFFENPIFTFLSGIIAMLIGSILLYSHSLCVNDWTMILALFGWAAIGKGVILLIYPQLFQFFIPIFSSASVQKWIGGVLIIFGIIFGYFAYI